MIAELTGRVLQAETAPGGGLAAFFRVDAAEGSLRAWAWWPSDDVPRLWQLMIPATVSRGLGDHSIAGRRVRIQGEVAQTDGLEMAVSSLVVVDNGKHR